MLPKELQQLFDEKDFDDIDIQIISTVFNPNSTEIIVHFNPDTPSFKGEVLIPQRWIISIQPIVEYRISSESYGNFEIVDQHPFLQRHKEQSGELYFTGPVHNAYEVSNALLDAHEAAVEGFEHLYTYMGPIRLMKVAESKSALLANGPIGILNVYKEVLDAFGIKSTIVKGKYPTYWNGENRVDTTDMLKMLDMGDTYFIGETFNFTKVGIQ